MLTFHTLGLIKMQSRAGEVEPVQRQQVERDLMASAQSIVAFSSHERDAMVQGFTGPTPAGLCWCPVELIFPSSAHWTKIK